jgi:hypothetical protein
MRDCAETLPDRNDSDIPEQVQWFLSLCELANIWYEWMDENMDTERGKFCEGVVDYWWNSDMIEPTMDMIQGKHTLPPDDERIAYQKGAIIGYELAERFKDDQ